MKTIVFLAVFAMCSIYAQPTDVKTLETFARKTEKYIATTLKAGGNAAQMRKIADTMKAQPKLDHGEQKDIDEIIKNIEGAINSGDMPHIYEDGKKFSKKVAKYKGKLYFKR